MRNTHSWLLCALVLSSPAIAHGISQGDSVKVVSEVGHPRLTLYAWVRPIQRLNVRAGARGILKNIRVTPGQAVTKDQTLARLGGVTWRARYESDKANLIAAKKLLDLGRNRLSIIKARYPVFSNRSSLDRAYSALSKARAMYVSKKAAFLALESHRFVKSPVNGSVISIVSADGELVHTGQSVLKIEPDSSLWLRGTVYAKEIRQIHSDMHGLFHSSSGSKPVPVKVVHMIPNMHGSGVDVGLVATSKNPAWEAGESGFVRLEGKSVKEPVVPTRALVLSDGSWWLVEVSHGQYKKIRVRPNFSLHGHTWIASGIHPGVKVVVEHSYLIFHRFFSKHYAGD